MLKIIVVDARENFLADINTRLLLDDRNIDVVSTLTSSDKLHNAIAAYKPDIVAICDNIVESQKEWNYADVVVVGYATTSEGKALIEKNGLACYGIVKNTTHLLNLMEGPVPSLEKKDDDEIKSPEFMPVINEDRNHTVEVKEEKHEELESFALSEPEKAKTTHEEISTKESNNEKTVHEIDVGGDQVRAQLMKLRRQNNIESAAKTLSAKIDNDIYSKKKPAKVVTVYSAKGGVGKTTISTEVAAYLALTGHGRGRYKTCIVDYNIDFGDVRSTLGLDNDGVDMCVWSMDIKERIQSGESPKDIEYSRKEIESYLQVMDKIGLFALCAPNTHEESMEIGQNELEIMLRNIINNGGFDFVVCDTGNNTRDSSFCALEAADYVLLIATQDVNAASCNKSAVETFEAIGFDMSKIRLVLNNAMSEKYTGLQARDVEEYFDRFPCIARVKHDMDIVKANNLSQPIVLQPNHEITKELKNIISFLTNGESVSEPQNKRGFFARLKRK